MAWKNVNLRVPRRRRISMKRKAILFAMGRAITAAVHLAARSVAAMPQSYTATPSRWRDAGWR